MEVLISTAEQILTTDGIPLKVSLKKTERKNKIRAFLLVFPLLLFILGKGLPPEAVYQAISEDIGYGNKLQIGRS